MDFPGRAWGSTAEALSPTRGLREDPGCAQVAAYEIGSLSGRVRSRKWKPLQVVQGEEDSTENPAGAYRIVGKPGGAEVSRLPGLWGSRDHHSSCAPTVTGRSVQHSVPLALSLKLCLPAVTEAAWGLVLASGACRTSSECTWLTTRISYGDLSCKRAWEMSFGSVQFLQLD